MFSVSDLSAIVHMNKRWTVWSVSLSCAIQSCFFVLFCFFSCDTESLLFVILRAYFDAFVCLLELHSRVPLVHYLLPYSWYTLLSYPPWSYWHTDYPHLLTLPPGPDNINICFGDLAKCQVRNCSILCQLACEARLSIISALRKRRMFAKYGSSFLLLTTIWLHFIFHHME